MFERKHEKLASLSVFIIRMVWSVVMAVLLIAVALFMGIMGYHCLAGFDWINSILEASMILGGMGPVSVLPNEAAKLFASGYALFSGLIFIAIMGVILAPLTHRMLHAFHINQSDLRE